MPSPLALWQQRVIDEQRELGNKIGALEKYLASGSFDALGPRECEQLLAQHCVMRWYQEILTDRIESF